MIKKYASTQNNIIDLKSTDSIKSSGYVNKVVKEPIIIITPNHDSTRVFANLISVFFSLPQMQSSIFLSFITVMLVELLYALLPTNPTSR